MTAASVNPSALNFRRRELLLGAAACYVAVTPLSLNAEQRYAIVVEGLQAPESPKPLADGSILICEMARGTLSRVTAGKIEVVAELGGAPNGVAVGPDGAAYVCNNGGFKFVRQGGLIIPSGPLDTPGIASIQRVDLRTGQHRELYLSINDVPLTAPNDLVFDRSGGFWFTDANAPYAGQQGNGTVNYARTDGALIKTVCGLPRANGIALSADGKTLFVAATGTAEIYAYSVIAPGVLQTDAKGLAISRLRGHAMGNVGFDSMAIDAQGYLAVGTLSFAEGVHGGVTVIAPNGKVSEFIELPEKFVTSVGFGGRNRRTAFITLTTSGKLVSIPWPRPGLKLA